MNEEIKNLKKKNIELNDELEIMKQYMKENENKDENNPKRLESLTSQEIEVDNDDSNAVQKITKLKKEIERLKLIENKYNELEKEKDKYQNENTELKKELDFIKLQNDNLNKKINKAINKDIITDIVKLDNFEIKGNPTIINNTN